MFLSSIELLTSSNNPWDGIFPVGLPNEKFKVACRLA